ncbi:MAG: anti-sigma factor [Hirschia sp.]|nr:anti-sigma factor [Hirschia sp.]MBF18588.1 anti-sigma factor [Hirschia sp.]
MKVGRRMTPDILNRLEKNDRDALMAGRADPGVALLVDTMVAMKPDIGAQADIVSGALLEMEVPASIAADALETVMARIDALPESRPAAQRKAASSAVSALDEIIRLPDPLREIVLEQTGSRDWKFAGPGIRSMDLDLGGDTHVQIIRLQPGQGVPLHTHGGSEYTLCLQGGFSDERGSYGPGELSVADSDVMHRPVADEDGVCLVLAVTDAGLKFTGVLGVLQRIFG